MQHLLAGILVDKPGVDKDHVDCKDVAGAVEYCGDWGTQHPQARQSSACCNKWIQKQVDRGRQWSCHFFCIRKVGVANRPAVGGSAVVNDLRVGKWRQSNYNIR